MNNITKEEMKEIKGGAINWGTMATIGAMASFLIGIIDGWVHTKRCN